jgi:SNF family Na+-dependent transporter
MRQHWGSRIGIILAVAGSAVGLGNFLRFPVQAAKYGGGAFMIPYFISLLLLGIPLMWVEWTLGRYGGGFGHSTAPGIFHNIGNKNRFIRYFGVIGIFGPLVIFIYYTYIESWLLAYSFFALSGKYMAATSEGAMKSFLSGFQGLEQNQFFQNIGTAYFFFIITFCLNVFVIYYGIKGGIERLCKIAMPLLLVFAIIILIRVISLGTPNPEMAEWSIKNGFGFLWNPDFSALLSAKTWLAAAGQIFFTLSVGIGAILTYASYLKKNDDVVLSGLTAVGANEFAEVILGGSIIIPMAFAVFGPKEIISIANSGSFNLGFVTMPLIFEKIPAGTVFGFLWFALMFLAGVTSSVSLAQPAVAFMEDEFDISRPKASLYFGIAAFILCQPAIFGLKYGVVDELDFWGGTFSLVLFGTIEVILFAWVFGMNRAWEEIHCGAELRVPKIYKFIIKYITPVFLLVILVSWFLQDGLPTILMKSVPGENRVIIVALRVILALIFIAISLGVWSAWRKRGIKAEKEAQS